MRVISAICVCAAALAVGGCQAFQEIGSRGATRVQMKPVPRVQVTAESGETFRGFDLTTAPRTSQTSALPDLWEESPKGSGSFEIRKDVVCVYSGLDGAVYHIPGKDRFYIQHDPAASSTMTFYGPFEGDPTTVLDLGTSGPAGTSAPADAVGPDR